MNAQDLNLQPGDVITVRATVKQAIYGFDVLVNLFCGTGEYATWIRTDLVVDLLARTADADEPVAGSFAEFTEPGSTQPGSTQPTTVWRRDKDVGWLLVNRESVGAHTWRELKANSASWRLLHDGDDD